MSISEVEPIDARAHREHRVGKLEPQYLVDLWTRVTSRITKLGFAVEYRDLDPPKTGTFNGLMIFIDPDVGFEMQCFIVLHLFGHSVQWVAPSLEHKLAALESTRELEAFLVVLRDYEWEAARFGLQLLHEVGVTHLDRWFSDFVATDWRYVERYYREGCIPRWDECLSRSGFVMQPLAIPKLAHREVRVRFAF
jgi:hypothetical protein